MAWRIFTMQRKRGPRLPYFAEQASEVLADTKHLILLSTQAPVSFFAYPDKPSWLAPDGCNLVTLAERDEDVDVALRDLGQTLGVRDDHLVVVDHQIPSLPTGATTPKAVGELLARFMPDNAVIVDEGGTSGGFCWRATRNALPHDWLMLTGRSIGYGLPCAVGAAIACPDRPVICLQADGSGDVYQSSAVDPGA